MLNKLSLNVGLLIIYEKNSGVRNFEFKKVNFGWRGESGLKVLKYDVGVEICNKEDDIVKSVIVEDVKFVK